MPVILTEEREKDWLTGEEIELFTKESVDLKAVPIQCEVGNFVINL
jgi:putative SOS response-associated peptidase YedK